MVRLMPLKEVSIVVIPHSPRSPVYSRNRTFSASDLSHQALLSVAMMRKCVLGTFGQRLLPGSRLAQPDAVVETVYWAARIDSSFEFSKTIFTASSILCSAKIVRSATVLVICEAEWVAVACAIML